MPSSKSETERIWKDILARKSDNQRRILKWQLQAREPICSFSDMKAGDHLIIKRKSNWYEHHFLCVGSKGEGRPTIIHYYNTSTNVIGQLFETVSFSSSSASGQVAIVQEITLPHNGFLEDERKLQEKGAEVERVVWPEELQRYSVNYVVERARSRVGEKFYHLADNNCECFVMWCLCGMNISLQATLAVGWACELGSGVINAGKAAFCKGIAEGVEVALVRRGLASLGSTAIKGLSKLAVCLGVPIQVLLEVVMAIRDIHEAKKKRKEGILITSREEFVKEVTDIVVLKTVRGCGSIAGMIIGQLFIPIPFFGGFIGAVVGALCGHFIGKHWPEVLKKVVAFVVGLFVE